jgi:hypothetical protein
VSLGSSCTHHLPAFHPEYRSGRRRQTVGDFRAGEERLASLADQIQHPLSAATVQLAEDIVNQQDDGTPRACCRDQTMARRDPQ